MYWTIPLEVKRLNRQHIEVRDSRKGLYFNTQKLQMENALQAFTKDIPRGKNFLIGLKLVPLGGVLSGCYKIGIATKLGKIITSQEYTPKNNQQITIEILVDMTMDDRINVLQTGGESMTTKFEEKLVHVFVTADPIGNNGILKGVLFVSDAVERRVVRQS